MISSRSSLWASLRRVVSPNKQNMFLHPIKSMIPFRALRRCAESGRGAFFIFYSAEQPEPRKTGHRMISYLSGCSAFLAIPEFILIALQSLSILGKFRRGSQGRWTK